MSYLASAVILFGVANFFIKLARYRMDTISIMAWEGLAAAVMVVAAVFLRNTALSISTDKFGAFWALCGGAAVFVGSYLLLEALGKIKLAIAMPFFALNVLVSALLGVLILGERLGLWHTVGALGMVISAMLLSLPEGK